MFELHTSLTSLSGTAISELARAVKAGIAEIGETPARNAVASNGHL